MKKLFGFLITLIIIFGFTTAASAQYYRFSLDKESVNIYLNDDGSMSLEYQFYFTNDSSADAIDFVDVGLPNAYYEYYSISADVDGNPVSISSDYQGDGDYGIAVDMGSYAIQAGRSGLVHVYVGQIEHIFYNDSQDTAYASMNFYTTYFGSSFVHGYTDLTVTIHMPYGVQPDESRYHTPGSNWPGSSTPEATLTDGRVTYTWQTGSANGYTQYTFGASLPKTYLPESAIVKEPLISIDWEAVGGVVCLCAFGLMFFGIPILSTVSQNKRKLQYLPPKISIEGHGIKRGLTAVEAALLMEQPLDKIMTMILFGVIKKEAATVTSKDPLNLKVTSPIPEGLHEYERDFLAAFKESNLSTRRKQLQEMMVKLVQSVSEKMKGFSRKETVAYYKSIMERAWQQIEAAGTPEVKSQMYEEALEWTMLDSDYDERTRRTLTGPVFVPIWWGRYDPSYSPSAPKTASVTPPPPGTRTASTSVPGANLAASIVTSVQNFSSNVLGGTKTFTSSVTNRTNPMPKPSTTRSGGGRSSGGSGCVCACACACAGCACACAGGGR